MILDIEIDRDLVRGTLIRRRHRFLVDIELGTGEVVTAHCANPGRMEGMIRTGLEVWLSKAPLSKRKLKWRWELATIDGKFVSANSWQANNLVRLLLEARCLPGFKQHRTIEAEKKIGRQSRIDFAINDRKGVHLLEVKNGHLVYPDNAAYFPDSVSVRGVRQLRDMTKSVRAGGRATVLVTVQRIGVELVRPSDVHDPAFAKAVRRAAEAGVKFRAVLIEPKLRGFSVIRELPVDLRPYPTEQLRRWHELGKQFSGWERPKGDLKAAWRHKRNKI